MDIVSLNYKTVYINELIISTNVSNFALMMACTLFIIINFEFNCHFKKRCFFSLQITLDIYSPEMMVRIHNPCSAVTEII